jgi:hypothetical protein
MLHSIAMLNTKKRKFEVYYENKSYQRKKNIKLIIDGISD